MGFLKVLKHIGIVLAGLIVIIGIPLLATGYIGALFSGSLDAVSSASVVLDQPSGDFLVLINRDFHTDEETLNDWISFFSAGAEEGGDLPIIFEDIAASVAIADPAGAEMADSLRSQLPENQMKVTKEDATLLMSRADKGLFDIIIMSSEFAEGYHAETAYENKSNVQVVEIRSK